MPLDNSTELDESLSNDRLEANALHRRQEQDLSGPILLRQMPNVADIVDNAAGQVNIIRQVLLNSQRQLDQLGSFRSSILCGSSYSYQLLHVISIGDLTMQSIWLSFRS